MRYGGIVITIFYALVVAYLFVFGFYLLVNGAVLTDIISSDFYQEVYEDFRGPKVAGLIPWLLWPGLLICSQVILLFLSVDQSHKRLRPHQHILVSAGAIAFPFSLLTVAATFALVAGILGDAVVETVYFGWFAALWIFPVAVFWVPWGFVFYRYRSGSLDKLHRMFGWLIKGSVLALLIVLPCHIIVRHRENLFAPLVTGFGVATGIAVMLMALGPSAFFRYQKRLAQSLRLTEPSD
jgi:uncharacterized membrane protein